MGAEDAAKQRKGMLETPQTRRVPMISAYILVFDFKYR